MLFRKNDYSEKMLKVFQVFFVDDDNNTRHINYSQMNKKIDRINEMVIIYMFCTKVTYEFCLFVFRRTFDQAKNFDFGIRFVLVVCSNFTKFYLFVIRLNCI